MNNQQRTRLVWQLTLILYAALLIGLCVDHLLLRPRFFWIVLLLQMLPLVPLLPGLIKQRTRSGLWVCFLSLFYFLIFVEHAAMDSTNRIAYVVLVITSISLFTAALLYARWSRQSLHTDAITTQDNAAVASHPEQEKNHP